jgi:hypothetical protein
MRDGVLTTYTPHILSHTNDLVRARTLTPHYTNSVQVHDGVLATHNTH